MICPTAKAKFLATSSFQNLTMLQQAQHLLPPFIFLFLKIMNIPIHFHDQPRFVTVEIDDESLNDLLPPKADSQLTPPQFFPQDFLGGSHLTAKFARALEFFFGDVLTWNDVLDWHNGILPLSRLPQGGEAKTILKPSIALQTEHAIRRRKEVKPIPSPFGRVPVG